MVEGFRRRKSSWPLASDRSSFGRDQSPSPTPIEPWRSLRRPSDNRVADPTTVPPNTTRTSAGIRTSSSMSLRFRRGRSPPALQAEDSDRQSSPARPRLTARCGLQGSADDPFARSRVAPRQAAFRPTPQARRKQSHGSLSAQPPSAIATPTITPPTASMIRPVSHGRSPVLRANT